MSDDETRSSFAELRTEEKPKRFPHGSSLRLPAKYSFRFGSRLPFRKAKGKNELSCAQLRSSFGRSED
jgi:hypothetical protein